MFGDFAVPLLYEKSPLREPQNQGYAPKAGEARLAREAGGHGKSTAVGAIKGFGGFGGSPLDILVPSPIPQPEVIAKVPRRIPLGPPDPHRLFVGWAGGRRGSRTRDDSG